MNAQRRRHPGLLIELGAACCAAFSASAVRAQDSSLLLQPAQGGQPLSLQNGSFIYRELPPEARMRELHEHDVITVIVNHSAITTSEGDTQARKTSTIDGVLSNWLKFDGKSVKKAPQTDGDPQVTGNYSSQYRTQSNLELHDTMQFKIAAEVIEIRPNGSLYIEGQRDIENNENHWRIFISGTVRREAITPDRTVTSDSIVGMVVKKEEVGQVRDGYARGWFSTWYDKFKPF